MPLKPKQPKPFIFLAALVLISACGGSDSGSSDEFSGTGGDSLHYGTATLSWSPPTENTSGSTLVNLAGYNIYYGTESGNYINVININNPGLSEYMVDNLPSGYTYYFVITAIDSNGVESEYSAVASKTIPS